MAVRKRELVCLLLVSAAANTAQAELKWGAFKDNGCASVEHAPGLRAMSAILWGVPGGASWEDHCARTGASFGDTTFKHPAVCVNTAAKLIEGLTSRNMAMDVLEPILRSAIDTPLAAVIAQGRMTPWPGSSLPGAVPAGDATWKARLAAAVEKKPTRQVKVLGGGLNIWGVFLVPDEACLEKGYQRMARPANWRAASGACSLQHRKLCTRAQLCADGKPVAGSPAGDVWAAVGDHENAWIAIGTAPAGRLCKSHEEVAGTGPAWGIPEADGPETVTGQQTAFRCCP